MAVGITNANNVKMYSGSYEVAPNTDGVTTTIQKRTGFTHNIKVAGDANFVPENIINDEHVGSIIGLGQVPYDYNARGGVVYLEGELDTPYNFVEPSHFNQKSGNFAYNKKGYIAYLNCGHLCYSLDYGDTWYYKKLNTDNETILRCATTRISDPNFVAIEKYNTSKVWYSQDLITWGQTTMPISGNWCHFIIDIQSSYPYKAYSYNTGKLYTSANGLNWSNATEYQDNIESASPVWKEYTFPIASSASDVTQLPNGTTIIINGVVYDFNPHAKQPYTGSIEPIYQSTSNVKEGIFKYVERVNPFPSSSIHYTQGLVGISVLGKCYYIKLYPSSGMDYIWTQTNINDIINNDYDCNHTTNASTLLYGIASKRESALQAFDQVLIGGKSLPYLYSSNAPSSGAFKAYSLNNDSALNIDDIIYYPTRDCYFAASDVGYIYKGIDMGDRIHWTQVDIDYGGTILYTSNIIVKQ